MIVSRRIVFRGNCHCIAFPLELLTYAGLKPGGMAIVEAADDGTIRVRRAVAADLARGVEMPSMTLDAKQPGAK